MILIAVQCLIEQNTNAQSHLGRYYLSNHSAERLEPASG